MATGTGKARVRGAYHHGDLRAALIAAATQLAAERPLEEVSLREVARRAGVSRGAPYHHFADKAEMLQAVANAAFDQLERALKRAQKRAGDDPLDQLRGVALAYMRFATSKPNTFRAMFRVSATEQKPRAGGPGPLNQVIDLVGAALRSGGYSDTEAARIALVCWSTVHGLATLWLDGPLKRTPGIPRRAEPMIDDVISTIVTWVANGATRGST